MGIHPDAPLSSTCGSDIDYDESLTCIGFEIKKKDKIRD
jgi:hypothetical protein